MFSGDLSQWSFWCCCHRCSFKIAGLWCLCIIYFYFFQSPLWLITRCWETLLPQEKLQTHAEQTNPLFMYFLEHKYKHRASVGLLHNSSLMHHQILQSSAILASSLWLLFVSLYGVHQLIMQHRNSPWSYLYDKSRLDSQMSKATQPSLKHILYISIENYAIIQCYQMQNMPAILVRIVSLRHRMCHGLRN